jgi:iron complex outermembrane receptor protein
VPEATLFAQLRQRIGAVDLSAQARLQSELYVDDRNSDSAPGYAVVSLTAARTVEWGSHRPRLFARIDNLFAKRYAGSVIVNEGSRRFFEPAPGRALMAGIDWPF